MFPDQFWKSLEEISFEGIVKLTKIALCLSYGVHCMLSIPAKMDDVITTWIAQREGAVSEQPFTRAKT